MNVLNVLCVLRPGGRGRPSARVHRAAAAALGLAALALPVLAQRESAPSPADRPTTRPAEDGATALPGAEFAAELRALDLDRAWVRLLEAERRIGGTPAEWNAWLAEHRLTELLEWRALTSRESWGQDGGRLAALGDPRWVRVAVWCLDRVDSHSFERAESALRADPERALGWLEAYPPPPGSSAARLAESLREEGVTPRRDPTLLPPLTDRDVFGPLLDLAEARPAPPLAEGARAPAGPDPLAVARTLRSIDALTATRRRPPAALTGLVALTRSPIHELRVAALRAHAFLAPHEVVIEPLLALAADEDEPDEIRSLAVLALSYGPDPYAWHELVRLFLLDPDHPGWPVAVSRLGDLGDRLTLDLFEGVLAARLARETGAASGTDTAPDASEPSDSTPESSGDASAGGAPGGAVSRRLTPVFDPAKLASLPVVTAPLDRGRVTLLLDSLRRTTEAIAARGPTDIPAAARRILSRAAWTAAAPDTLPALAPLADHAIALVRSLHRADPDGPLADTLAALATDPPPLEGPLPPRTLATWRTHLRRLAAACVEGLRAR